MPAIMSRGPPGTCSSKKRRKKSFSGLSSGTLGIEKPGGRPRPEPSFAACSAVVLMFTTAGLFCSTRTVKSGSAAAASGPARSAPETAAPASQENHQPPDIENNTWAHNWLEQEVENY